MGIYFILPLWIMTAISIVAFYLANKHIRESFWVRFVAPAISTFLLCILFVITSLNLKLLVSSQNMVVISMLGVVLIPASGAAVAVIYRKTKPNIYDSI